MTTDVEKMSAIERLEALLNERDDRIAELEAKIEKQKDDEDEDAWLWTRHSLSEEKEGLPVPRLEIRWSPLGRGGGWNWLASYNLVYRHMLGDITVVPLGATRTSSGRDQPIDNGEVRLPFREAAHIAHDAFALNLPAYAVYNGVVNQLKAGTHKQLAASPKIVLSGKLTELTPGENGTEVAHVEIQFLTKSEATKIMGQEVSVIVSLTPRAS